MAIVSPGEFITCHH